jgi:hypothetical protein
MSAIPQCLGASRRRPKATPCVLFCSLAPPHQSRQSTTTSANPSAATATTATSAAVSSTAGNTTTKVSRDLEQLDSRLVCCCGPTATLAVSPAQLRRELLGVVFLKLAFLPLKGAFPEMGEWDFAGGTRRGRGAFPSVGSSPKPPLIA